MDAAPGERPTDRRYQFYHWLETGERIDSGRAPGAVGAVNPWAEEAAKIDWAALYAEDEAREKLLGARSISRERAEVEEAATTIVAVDNQERLKKRVVLSLRIHATLAWQWAVGEDAVDNEEGDASPRRLGPPL